MIQSNSKRKIQIKDVLSLPWDKKPKEYDEEVDKRLSEYEQNMLDMLNSGQLKLEKNDRDMATDLFRKTPK